MLTLVGFVFPEEVAKEISAELMALDEERKNAGKLYTTQLYKFSSKYKVFKGTGL